MPTGYEPSGIYRSEEEKLNARLSNGILVNGGNTYQVITKIGRPDPLCWQHELSLKDNRRRWKFLYPKTRFEVTRNSSRKFDISCDIKLNTLPRETTYATYLVYKQEGDYSVQPGPAHVRDKESVTKDIQHIYLQTPQTPVIDKNTYNTSHRPKIKGLPKQRSDDWMEVQIWEFRTTNKSILVRLELFSYDDSLEGIEVQGIEFRPV
ncbi:kinase-like domain, phloem protein 2-like protein [Tanacetum coccineum]